ncbi:hypothetical protein H4R34_003271 [Dimargaris verticillata]|uniref:Uncharacterized protein n=1 Tax=Dimargaris verticillata TaxID=2761393 RepID=A0A9W8ECT1_9FUNG|nr:hypothetical protein H4R34_003271 [Dimargaris verticillata]
MGTRTLSRRLFLSGPIGFGRTLAHRHYSATTGANTADIRGLYQAICQGHRAALSRAITLAYIRPSPSRGTLGGVAKNTHESMLLCEGGDELQGLKKGVMELADMVIVNKADGELLNAARRAKMEYTSALKFMHPRTPEWRVPVTMVSATTGKGLTEAWAIMQQFHMVCENQGLLQRRRGEQRKRWLWNNVSTLLTQKLTSDPELRHASQRLEDQVVAGTITPSGAARQILDHVLNQWHHERLRRQQS